MALTRFGVSLEAGLLERFDRALTRKGYANRSEAIRDLIRDSLVREQTADGVAAGTITIVYDHHASEIAHTLMDLQHGYHNLIISTMHIHLDSHNCLEVLVMRGRARKIREIADRVIGTKGVIHGKLTLTTTGRDLR